MAGHCVAGAIQELVRRNAGEAARGQLVAGGILPNRERHIVVRLELAQLRGRGVFPGADEYDAFGFSASLIRPPSAVWKWTPLPSRKLIAPPG